MLKKIKDIITLLSVRSDLKSQIDLELLGVERNPKFGKMVRHSQSITRMWICLNKVV